ncbi:hypothetical protein SDC9_133764 [bioreactor metagenome]|uniref:Uncharacterized protein n=1 Tax=bioreactor metagenome TaxID=1076179 RepID=A0A645DCM5_9ZZZZ
MPSSSETGSTPATGLTVSPLIKIAPKSGSTVPSLRFFTMENGILYLTALDDGYVAGYFELSSKLIADCVIKKADAKSDTLFKTFSTGNRKAISVFGDEIFISDLMGDTYQAMDIGKAVNLKNALLRDDTQFIYENDSYILTDLIDLQLDRILARKANLANYAALMTLSADEKKVYYATGSDGNYTGYAYFDYGNSEVIGVGIKNMAFNKFDEIAPGRVLLTEDKLSETVYTYVNLDSGDTRSITIPSSTLYYGYRADSNGKLLVAYTSSDTSHSGGNIDIYSFSDCRRIASVELNEYKTNPDIALTLDGRYVIFSRWSLDNDDKEGELICYIDLLNLIK